MSDTMERLGKALADRYELEREIGRGGMATVYLARDIKHGRPVAIKVFHSELTATIGADRFNREVEIAARLQHPHILPVHDSGEADGILFYVMPYVDGESLEQLAERGEVSPKDALRIVREVASALDYAHQNGVIHRDVKPANILISQGHAVVADFGIARAVAASEGDGLTQVGMALGTPSYMSPEQAMADPGVDGRSDIYALAAVLYELLAGHPPYQAPTAQAIIAANVSAPIPDMTDLQKTVPEATIASIRRGLAKDPSERFATAGEFGAALELNTSNFDVAKPSRTPVMVAAMVAVAVALGFWWFAGQTEASTVASGADVIAVLPFSISGTEEELGEGMVNLLSTNLNAVGQIRAVDARTVLQRWRQRGGEAGLDLAGSLEVGRDVNAGSILLGSIVAAGSGVRLSAEMYTVEGNELARVQIDGNADDVLLLVDSLSLQILRAIWRSNQPLPSVDVAAITSGSLEAVRAFMRGATHFRHGRFDSALVGFERAVDVDSTFALAHLALSLTYGWTGNHGTETQLEAVARAERFADRLPPRERLLVAAHSLNNRRDLTAIDSIRVYVRRYPADSRGWYAFGDFQFHQSDRLRLSPDKLLEPFERAIELDSSLVAALIHPMEIALRKGDREAFEQYLAMTKASGGSDRGYPVIAEALWGPEDGARGALDSLVQYQPNLSMVSMGMALQAAPDRISMYEEALAKRIEQGDPNILTVLGHAMAAMALGHRDALDDTITLMESSDDATFQGVGGLLRLLAVLSGVMDTEYADPMVENRRAAGDDNRTRFVEAILALHDGNADRATDRLRGVKADTVRQRNLLVRAMRGWASMMQGDTAAGIAELRPALDSVQTEGLGNDQLVDVFRLQLGLALARQPQTREEGIRRLRYGFNMFVIAQLYPSILLAQAEAMEAAGDLQGARMAYADFVDLWKTADPALQPRVTAARDAIERLTRETN